MRGLLLREEGDGREGNGKGRQGPKVEGRKRQLLRMSSDARNATALKFLMISTESRYD